MRVREHVGKVAELRRRIREADESVSDWEFRDLWDEAQFELGKVRLLSNTDRKIVGLEGFGIEIVERVPIPTRVTPRRGTTALDAG